MNLELLNEIDSFVWGPPLLVLLVGTGVFLSLRLGFLQVARLPKALGLIFKAKSQGEGDTSSFRALCTALAATIGTGNIVGVATAVKAGGPGALFWMWVAGVLRHGDQVRGRVAGCEIPRCGRTRRNCRRPHVLY